MKAKSALRTATLSLATFTLAITPVTSASLSWDIDGTTAGAGGASPAGAWTTGGTTWSTDSNGTAAATPATTQATDDLFFSAGVNATGAYTITLNDAQNAGSLVFQDGTATISGAGGVINLGGTGVINVTNSLLVVPNTAVIGANTNTIIGGSTGLTKVGVGTLTLSNSSANAFTGGINVNGGTLALDFTNMAAPTNLIDSGNTLVLGGGNLSITGNAAGTTEQTLGNVTVNSGGGSLLVNPNGGTATNITLGSLTNTASGGGFVVGRAVSSSTGTLAITTTTDKDATGIYGGRVVFADGTANTGYDWATTSDVASPFALAAYTGYAALDVATVGSVADTNNSRITAGAVLPAASNRSTNSLKFENPAASSTFDIAAGNTLFLTSGGLLMTGGNTNINIVGGSITAGNGLAPADLSVHQFNPAQQLSVGLTGGTLGNTPEISSAIVNNNGQPVTLVKNGPGSMRFMGTNTFTGGVIVNQGSVDFGTNSLNNNSITFNANGFLYTNGAHVTSGGITLNNGSQVTVCNNNSSFTVNANVTGSGGLGAANGGQGAMTLNLNGTANTFTGPVRFAHSNGTQQCTINVASLPDTDTLGTGNITFGTGAVSSTTQNFNLASTAVAPHTLNNRRFEMAGPNVNQQINNSSNQPLTINTDLLVTGSQGKNLQFGGDGTGLSTFSGAIGNHPSPTAPGTIQNAVRKTANGTTLTLASVDGIVVGATITGSILTAGTTITAINPLTREVTLSTGYTGGNNSNFNVGVLFTIPGVVNSNSVTKAGTGTWVLSGNNSYTGPTAINAGTLLINGNQSLATGAVAVNGSSTLGGSGTTGGTVTVAAAAKIAPGNAAVGTLAIGGGLNISAMAGGAGTLNFELNTVAASDKITVTGTADIGSGTLDLDDLVLTGLGGLQAGTYKLITSGAPITGPLGANTTGTLGDFDIELQINGNDLELLVGGGPVNDYSTWAATFLPTVVGLPEEDDDGDGLSNDQERIFGLNPTNGTSSNPISVPLDSSNGTFSFTRRDTSLTGLIYKVWYSTNLVAWEVDENAVLTPGTVVNQVQPVAVLLDENLLDEPKLFLKVGAEVPVPPAPLLSVDFEADDGGFTVATLGGTPWAHGTPNSPSQGGGAVTSGAGASAKCWGTNLISGYAANTDTSLRSPVIDLTSVTAATLTFAKAIDSSAGHTLEVNVIDDTTDTVIANIIPATQDDNTAVSPWETVAPVALPGAAFGQPVRIEWRFVGNGDTTYNGAYIDDVTVTETP